MSNNFQDIELDNLGTTNKMTHDSIELLESWHHKSHQKRLIQE